MFTLGELERSVMDVLWASTDPLTAYDLRDHLADNLGEPVGNRKPLAVTTVLTVLSRLENKGFVARERRSRPHHYTAIGTREDHMAKLMHEVLGTAINREAVLEHFVGRASSSETETLRKLLEGRAPR